MTRWNIGPYLVEYSLSVITISNGKFYIKINDSEAVTVFDVFTNDCTDELAIDKYFEIAKLPTNEE